MGTDKKTEIGIGVDIDISKPSDLENEIAAILADGAEEGIKKGIKEGMRSLKSELEHELDDILSGAFEKRAQKAARNAETPAQVLARQQASYANEPGETLSQRTKREKEEVRAQREEARNTVRQGKLADSWFAKRERERETDDERGLRMQSSWLSSARNAAYLRDERAQAQRDPGVMSSIGSFLGGRGAGGAAGALGPLGAALGPLGAVAGGLLAGAGGGGAVGALGGAAMSMASGGNPVTALGGLLSVIPVVGTMLSGLVSTIMQSGDRMLQHTAGLMSSYRTEGATLAGATVSQGRLNQAMSPMTERGIAFDEAIALRSRSQSSFNVPIRAASLARAELMGVGGGALSDYESAVGRYGGQMGGSSESLAAMMYARGMRGGAGMGMLTSHAERMGQAGMSYNDANFGDFLGRALGDQTLGRAPQATIGAAIKLDELGVGTKQTIGQPLEELARNLSLMDAYQQGAASGATGFGFLGASMGAAERQDPERMRQLLGGVMGSSVFQTMGLTQEQGAAFGGALGPSMGGGELPEQSGVFGDLSKFFARASVEKGTDVGSANVIEELQHLNTQMDLASRSLAGAAADLAKLVRQ